MADSSDIKIAASNLLAKAPAQTLFYDYYDGDQAIVYSTDRLNAVFGSINARFTENWCAVVVDSALSRMNLLDLQVQNDEGLTGVLQQLRETSGLTDDEDIIHEDLCVTGEAYVLVEQDEEGVLQAYRNDPRNCHVQYFADTPRKARFAAKWWSLDDGRIRLNLYYADHVERYLTAKAPVPGAQIDQRAFVPWSDDPVTPYDYGIPMFHFRTNKRRLKSGLENVIEPQDMLNKLLADMMVAAEFGAYAQRYVISQAGIEGLKNRPFGIWDLVASDGEGQPTTAGQFPHTPLANYLEAINKIAADIGVITSTPRHYFYTQGGDPSGEALLTMESPLNQKVKKMIRAVSPTWRALGSHLLTLAGVPVASESIWANYAPPETTQPKTQAEIRKLGVEAGMPLTNILRDEGWTEADLQQLQDDKAYEQEQQATFVDAALESARTRFDQGAEGE